MKNTKVLLVHRFFYPDSPPYALILDDMHTMLRDEGFVVDVLSSQPSYKSVDKDMKLKYKTENADGSTVYRLPVFKLNNAKVEKVLNYFWFPVIVFLFLLFHRKYQIITVSTAPQIFLASFVSIIAKMKGSKLVYHCMDIHPEIGRLSGEFKNKFIFNILLWIDNMTCRISSKIIVLSSDMKKVLVDRNDKILNKIEIINNYDLSDESTEQKQFFTDDQKKTRIVFTGNIGRYQNLNSFVLALRDYGCIENFELVFVGEGGALKELKKLSEPVISCVRFIPHQSIAVARQIISEADMGIVSLQEEVVKYAYPSKTMTYLSEGTPVLACVEKDSELATFINDNKLGVSVEHSEKNKIYEVYQKLSLNTVTYDRKHIKKVFNEKFSKKQFNQKFIKLITNLKEKE